MASTSSPTIPLYLFTYNCGREFLTAQSLYPHLLSALHPTSPPPEILAIGLEEFAPLSYSFIGNSYVDPYLQSWSAVPTLAFQKLSESNPKHKGVEYVEIGRRYAGMTALLVFSSKPERVKGIQFSVVGFGAWGMANKGAVGARIRYQGAGGGEETDITIVAAHLAAHEHLCDRRNRDWEALVRGLVFESPSSGPDQPSSTGSDETVPLLDSPSSTSLSGIYTPTSHLLIMGDLNYRTASTSPTPQNFHLFPQTLKDLPDYFSKDQLTAERLAGRTLHGLTEAEITFPPTYKYRSIKFPSLPSSSSSPPSSTAPKSTGGTQAEAETQGPWNWAGYRWPSWCDRILWLPLPSQNTTPGEDITIHRYTSIPRLTFSDHRPVGLHVSLPPIKPTDVEPVEGDKDVRFNPPFPLDKDYKAKRESAEVKEVVAGYVILTVTTVAGIAIVACAVVGVGTLWWTLTAVKP
ncbi:hypothetical protein ABW19_dt0202803 [Dactylella cylindrospora]|nr:hypothetical protein ABW19_dt0202803 [Dactylella cylindrospora]